MLQEAGFYRIDEFVIPEKGKIHAEVVLNKEHTIFKGHFPGNPVVPGVCLIQISKEILEKYSGFLTSLVQSSQVKFLAIVDPEINSKLNINLDVNEVEGLLSINAVIFFGEIIFFKSKSSCRKI